MLGCEAEYTEVACSWFLATLLRVLVHWPTEVEVKSTPPSLWPAKNDSEDDGEHVCSCRTYTQQKKISPSRALTHDDGRITLG